MTREEIIRNLKYTMEKHKNDRVNTFDTNISVMCKDILDYLEQEPCEKCEVGNPCLYCKHEFSQKIEPCQTCRNEHTSFCGNCKNHDEYEPCTDAVSREAVLDAVSECCQELRGVYGRCEELINELPPVTVQQCSLYSISNDGRGLCALLEENPDDTLLAKERQIEALPSVNPQSSEHYIDGVHAMGYREGYKDAQKQKSGKWILLDECANSGYYCSECHKKLVKEGWSNTVKKINFCPNCGARMVEPQESEE